MSSGVANDTSMEILVEQQGTVTSLRRMPRSTSTRLVLNRKITVVVPKGVSQYFAGLQVIVRDVETPADWSVGRLSRALLGPTPPSGEHGGRRATLCYPL